MLLFIIFKLFKQVLFYLNICTLLPLLEITAITEARRSLEPIRQLHSFKMKNLNDFERKKSKTAIEPYEFIDVSYRMAVITTGIKRNLTQFFLFSFSFYYYLLHLIPSF